MLVVLIALLPGSAPGDAQTPLTLALTPSRDPTALKEAGDAFAKAITQLSGVPVKAIVASDYAGVIEALRSKRVDLAFVHPVGYVLAQREAGCRIMVRDVWQGKTAMRISVSGYSTAEDDVEQSVAAMVRAART